MGPTAAGRQSSGFKSSVQISVIIYIWPDVTCIGLLKVRHLKHWKENRALQRHRPRSQSRWNPSIAPGPLHSVPLDTTEEEKKHKNEEITLKKKILIYIFQVFFPLTVNFIFPSFICMLSLAASKLRSWLLSSVSEINSFRSSFSTYWWNTHTHTQWGLTFIKKIHLNLSLIFTQICVTTYIHVSLFIEEEQIVSTQACPQFPWCLHRHKHKHRHAESKVRYQAGEIVDVKRKTEDSCPVVLNKDRIKKCTLITQWGNKWGSCSLSACECGIRESDLMSQA